MSNEIKELPLDSIVSDSCQPRKSFDKVKLQELANSIKEHGLLQPILVRPIKNGKFQIVHGERRWRACLIAGLKSIKAEVRNPSEKEVLEIQLTENLQREDLNPIEEAETFQRMVNELHYTHEAIAKRIGKSREYVTNKLRLLRLPLEIQEKIKSRVLNEGHAKAILSLADLNKQQEVVKKISEERLSVREAEQLVRNIDSVPRGTSDDEDRVFLIPIPYKIYSILQDLAKEMKLKPENLMVNAVLAFAEKEMKS